MNAVRSRPQSISANEATNLCSADEKRILRESIFQSLTSENNTGSAHISGQERLISGVQLGVLSDNPYANIAMVGISSPKGFQIARKTIEQALAATMTDARPLKDWCYAYNARNPRFPLAIPLAPGSGRIFKYKIQKLLSRMKKRITDRLRQTDILNAKYAMADELQTWIGEQHRLFQIEKAKYPRFFIHGEIFAERINIFPRNPEASVDDTDPNTAALPRDALLDLSNEERIKFREDEETFLIFLHEMILGYNAKNQGLAENCEKIEQIAAAEIIENMWSKITISSSKEPYEPCPLTDIPDDLKNTSLVQFYFGLKEYAMNNYRIFLTKDGSLKDGEDKSDTISHDPFLPFKINVFVERTKEDSIPIIDGDVSSLHQFFGFVEYIPVHGGGIYTDHMHLYAGDIARANGGFIIINADEMLHIGASWYILKNTIRSQMLSLRLLYVIGAIPSLTLNPMPIDLSLRVVLFGSRYAFNILEEADPTFHELFSARADMSPTLYRSSESIRAIGAFLAEEQMTNKLLPITGTAADMLVEFSGRLAGDQRYFSTDFEPLGRAYRDANVFARGDGLLKVMVKHIEKALRERIYRSGLMSEILQRRIREGTQIIVTEGELIGEVNALVVQSYGGEAFGLPSRVASTASIGEAGIVNIHRDAGLTGPIYKKADATIEGFLKHRFGQESPLSAEIYFSMEQTYSSVEGDSASLAELFAVLSAISKIPIRQEIAITGSMSLRGNVQPIGGANEKIEGFFDVCFMLGELNGKHGVIIPHQNKNNLILRRDVANAIREGKFSVWPIQNLDEGITLLFEKNPEDIWTAARECLAIFSKGIKRHNITKHITT